MLHGQIGNVTKLIAGREAPTAFVASFDALVMAIAHDPLSYYLDMESKLFTDNMGFAVRKGFPLKQELNKL